MKTKLLAIVLTTLTVAAISGVLPIDARTWKQADHAQDAAVVIDRVAVQPVVDAVFVLDTTGSMSGLIETAKEKIWSIASTMASAQPSPRIRIGLVAYRDRGDDYVVKTVELSEDLDAVYAELMQFQANGGGDGPESVNAALDAAVNQLNWSDRGQAYRVVFLVGDAPPHMDYADEKQYPEIVAEARAKGIVINTIQCGSMARTAGPWTRIAGLGGGMFFQVEQAGSAVAYSTPYDSDLARLASRLDDTRLFYGTKEEQDEMAKKVAAAESIDALASERARARRGVFNLSGSGKPNRLGRNELVSDYASGEVDIETLEAEELPAAMTAMAPAEQKAHLDELVAERAEVEEEMKRLADARADYLRKKVEEEGGAEDSLDHKLYEAISRQSVSAGLQYEDGPAY